MDVVDDDKLIAFISYTHFDDLHNNEFITNFSVYFKDELKSQTGKNIPIFFDRDDISWGENWRKRIEESIELSAFLIPIISPSYFASLECCKELQLFVKKEIAMDRDDLILPIYFLKVPSLSQKPEDIQDENMRIISLQNYDDWRHLRNKTIRSSKVKKKIQELVKDLLNSQEKKSKSSNYHLIEKEEERITITDESGKGWLDYSVEILESGTLVFSIIDEMTNKLYSLSAKLQQHTSGIKDLSGNKQDPLFLHKVDSIVGESANDIEELSRLYEEKIPILNKNVMNYRKANLGFLMGLDFSNSELSLEIIEARNIIQMSFHSAEAALSSTSTFTKSIESLKGCKQILDEACDDLTEKSSSLCTIIEVIKNTSEDCLKLIDEGIEKNPDIFNGDTIKKIETLPDRVFQINETPVNKIVTFSSLICNVCNYKIGTGTLIIEKDEDFRCPKCDNIIDV